MSEFDGFSFTDEDIARSKPVVPDWYLAKVLSAPTKEAGSNAKYPGSKNWNVEFELQEAPYKGVKVYKTFNINGKGFFIPYFEGVFPGWEPKKGESIPDLVERSVGRMLKIHVKNKEYEGRILNEVDGYRPAA